MALKGAIAKQEITDKLFEFFPNAFLNGKEIRIPWKEDGEDVEIKVALTAAKDLIGGKQPSVAETTSTTVMDNITPAAAPSIKQVSEEEKKNLSDLLRSLGLWV